MNVRESGIIDRELTFADKKYFLENSLNLFNCFSSQALITITSNFTSKTSFFIFFTLLFIILSSIYLTKNMKIGLLHAKQISKTEFKSLSTIHPEIVFVIIEFLGLVLLVTLLLLFLIGFVEDLFFMKALMMFMTFISYFLVDKNMKRNMKRITKVV